MDGPNDPVAPIINCHTHIFTVEDVPPMLARTLAPWPLHYVIRTNWIAGLFGWWVKFRYDLRRKSWYKNVSR